MELSTNGIKANLFSGKMEMRQNGIASICRNVKTALCQHGIVAKFV